MSMHEDVSTLTQVRIRLLKMMLIHADRDPQFCSEVNFKTAVDFLPVHWWFKILIVLWNSIPWFQIYQASNECESPGPDYWTNFI